MSWRTVCNKKCSPGNVVSGSIRIYADIRGGSLKRGRQMRVRSLKTAIFGSFGHYQAVHVFAIFAAFMESMTLNLAQTSFKVIDFGTNRTCVYVFLLVVNSNLDPI